MVKKCSTEFQGSQLKIQGSKLMRDKRKGKGQLKDALHFSKQGTTPPFRPAVAITLMFGLIGPSGTKGHLGRKAIGVLIRFGKELNLISENFIFCSTFRKDQNDECGARGIASLRAVGSILWG